MTQNWSALLGGVGLVAGAAPSLPAASGLPMADPEQLGFAPKRLERIGAALKAEVAQGRIPGAVALVARRGRIAYWEAIGKRDPAKPAAMARHDLFRIYSMTKPIVSTAAMILAEEGRFILNDPVSKYIPALGKVQVAMPPAASQPGAGHTLAPAARAMTIQDLLRHTSGLTYGFRGTHLKSLYEQAEKGLEDLPGAQFVERLATLPLAFQPGTVWEYSRATDVLGHLVEVISGRPLGEFLSERILQPLGMADTGFWVPEAQWGRLTEAAPDPDTGKPQALRNVKRVSKFESGGSGLVSTAGDYARFAQLLLNGGALEGERLLGPRTVAWMTSDHLGAIGRGAEFLAGPGYGFGLGFAVREAAGLSPVPGSPGEYLWSGAAGTTFWVDPAQQLIAVLMLMAPSMRLYYRALFKTLVLQALVKPA